MGGDDALSGDPARQLVLAARVDKALEVRRRLDDELAVAIASRVAELFSD